MLPDFFEKSFPHAVVGALCKILLSVGVVTGPLFFDCINVENSLLLTVLDDITGGGAAGEIDEEAHLVDKHFVEDFFEVLGGESDLNEFDLFVLIGEVLWFRVDDGHLLKFEVPLDQGHCSSADGPMSNNADVINVAVEGIAFHLLFKVIIQL